MNNSPESSYQPSGVPTGNIKISAEDVRGGFTTGEKPLRAMLDKLGIPTLSVRQYLPAVGLIERIDRFLGGEEKPVVSVDPPPPINYENLARGLRRLAEGAQDGVVKFL